MRCLSFALALAAAFQINAITFTPGNDQSIKDAASNVATKLLSYYNEASVGVLPAPYYWWESGAMWGGLIQYWHYTGDAQYNDLVSKAIVSQISPTNDFMQPQCEGNDDQGWWALTSMSAAEYGFPAPAGAPSWFSLADTVFNEFTSRWDTQSCNGGMKWKISPSADGYHYKSSIANGVFFQLAARLARYTGDAKYGDWAEKVFDWMLAVKLIDADYNVFDGTDDNKNCIDVNHDLWTYNTGIFLYGSAIMQDYTSDPKWATRTQGLIKASSKFFESNIMLESKCEKDGTCNVDQLSFKAYLSRWLAATAIVLPETQGTIAPMLGASGSGAAASCKGGPNGQTCGSRWYTGTWDGTDGVGQQLAALEIIHGQLHGSASGPGARRRKTRRFQA
jgi:mannan endo-1,6-alpha-mannosidase